MSVRMSDFKKQAIGVMGHLRIVAPYADDFAAIGFDGGHAREAFAVGLVGMTGQDYVLEANERCKEISLKVRGIVLRYRAVDDG